MNKAASTSSLTSQPNPSAFGEQATFTAAVNATAPGAGTPSGTVTFREGGTDLGTADLTNGVATFTKSDLAIGSHNIAAAYSGDGNFEASTSTLYIHVVDKYGSQVLLAATPRSSPGRRQREPASHCLRQPDRGAGRHHRSAHR